MYRFNFGYQYNVNYHFIGVYNVPNVRLWVHFSICINFANVLTVIGVGPGAACMGIFISWGWGCDCVPVYWENPFGFWSVQKRSLVKRVFHLR